MGKGKRGQRGGKAGGKEREERDCGLTEVEHTEQIIPMKVLFSGCIHTPSSSALGLCVFSLSPKVS